MSCAEMADPADGLCPNNNEHDNEKQTYNNDLHNNCNYTMRRMNIIKRTIVKLMRAIQYK